MPEQRRVVQRLTDEIDAHELGIIKSKFGQNGQPLWIDNHFVRKGMLDPGNHTICRGNRLEMHFVLLGEQFIGDHVPLFHHTDCETFSKRQ